MPTFATHEFTLHGQRFELVRYADGAGRVYHLPSEHIVVEGAHLAPDGASLARSVAAWLDDPEHRTIQYSREETAR